MVEEGGREGEPKSWEGGGGGGKDTESEMKGKVILAVGRCPGASETSRGEGVA